MRYTRCAILVATTMLVGRAAAAQSPAPATTNRVETAGRFAVEITSPSTAHLYIQSLTGGQMVSDVVASQVGPDAIQKKRANGVMYSPMTLRGNDAELLRSFLAALDQPGLTFDGRILDMDFNYKIQSEYTFSKGVITQISLSALDAASKDPATVEITIAPAQVRWAKGSGADGRAGMGRGPSEKIGTNFQLTMPGVDMSRVRRIEALTMMHTGMGPGVGGIEYGRALPGKWEYGNIVLTLPSAYAKDLSQWEQDVKSGRADALEKTLDLHLLAGTREVLVLHATGVALVALRGGKVEANSETARQVQAELSVKGWQVVSSGTALR